MAPLDKVIVELPADIDGDANVVGGDGTEHGVFEMETDVEVQTRMRTSMLFENSLDRVMGLIEGGVEQINDKTSGNVNRTGLTEDVGGGKTVHQISFTEASGGSNQWGDGSDDAFVDATGDDAIRKKDVLLRYTKAGDYDSRKPARLKFGEYHEDGIYEDFIPCAFDNIRITINAEGDQTIEGQLRLFEVTAYTLNPLTDSSPGSSANGKSFY